jgi:hypothetical protein
MSYRAMALVAASVLMLTGSALAQSGGMKPNDTNKPPAGPKPGSTPSSTQGVTVGTGLNCASGDPMKGLNVDTGHGKKSSPKC